MAFDALTPLICIALVGLCLYIWPLRVKNFPPGPKPLPILGNAFDIPANTELLTAFDKWKDTFGPIVHIEALGKHIVVLNSLDVVTDLLDRRRKIYSDRPSFQMAGELMGARDTMTFIPCNDRWRVYRKMVRQALSPQATASFRSMQTHARDKYLESLYLRPENFIRELRLFVARVILNTTYGIFPNSPSDEYVALAEYCLGEVTSAALPGAWAVDIFPLMKLLPSWFPGCGFQNKASFVRKKVETLMERPFQHVRHDMEAGLPSHCFVSDLLRNMENSEDKEYNIKWTAGTMFAAGMDTSFAVVLSCIAMLLKHQNFQRIAQEEIDSILSTARLPEFADIPNLPYCDALLKEVMRYCPPVPLSIAHRCMEDDEYQGYHIPQGSTIIPNIWAITRDPTLYEDPEAFNPDRFLDKEKRALDPSTYIFGFGSRSCPGAALASDSFRMLTVSIVAAFTITFAKDKDGRDIIPDFNFSPTIARIPEPFVCQITPRPQYVEILRAGFNDDVSTAA